MTEATKRSLRNRRPPQHFNDGEETEGHGYTRMGNLKVSKIKTQEYSSPAQELNSIAKLISKFVNSANKRLKENGLPEHTNQKPVSEVKDNVDEKDKPQVLKDPPKKKNGIKLLPKNAGNSHKDQFLEQNEMKPIMKKQQNTIKDKSRPKQSNIFNDQQPNKNHLNFANQISQQKPSSLHFDREATQRAILQQQQMLLNSNNFHRSQFFPQKVIEKQPQNKQKLFGRSSYHIAIAYHIHLKNVKQSGADISSQSCLLDPTYYAKKLKGQIPTSS